MNIEELLPGQMMKITTRNSVYILTNVGLGEVDIQNQDINGRYFPVLERVKIVHPFEEGSALLIERLSWDGHVFDSTIKTSRIKELEVLDASAAVPAD